MPKSIDDLLAEAEIKDVHLRYCRANDRLDAELMRGCFHPDAVIELHEPFAVDAFIAFGQAALRHFDATWHNTGNQLVEVDGDVAWAEHYTVSSHRSAATADRPAADLVMSGRYLDRLERRDGTWRIARRTMVIDFARTDPVATDPSGGSRRGARDGSDPSYRRA